MEIGSRHLDDRVCFCKRHRCGAPPLTLQAFVPGSASTLVFADGSTTIMLEDDEPEE